MENFSGSVTMGASGLRVSRMGIGADSNISSEALEWAFERGVNYFYWGSRRRKGMAEAIRKLAPRWRDKMIIALQTYDYTGLALEYTFSRGLRELRIDYADVFILGMRNKAIPQRILDKALSLKERGLVRHLCVSAHDRAAYRSHLASGLFDLIMVRYNAAHRGADRDVFPYLKEGGSPGVICYNATRWAHLCDPRWMPDGERAPSPADLYRYALSNPNIHMVLTAPATFGQLKQNLGALEGGPVTDKERRWLERVGDHVHESSPSTTFDFLFQAAGPRRKRVS